MIIQGLLNNVELASFVLDIWYPWNNLFREVSISPAHSSIDKDGLQERARERNIFDAKLSQPPPDHEETASSVSEGSLCFSLLKTGCIF